MATVFDAEALISLETAGIIRSLNDPNRAQRHVFVDGFVNYFDKTDAELRAEAQKIYEIAQRLKVEKAEERIKLEDQKFKSNPENGLITAADPLIKLFTGQSINDRVRQRVYEAAERIVKESGVDKPETIAKLLFTVRAEIFDTKFEVSENGALKRVGYIDPSEKPNEKTPMLPIHQLTTFRLLTLGQDGINDYLKHPDRRIRHDFRKAFMDYLNKDDEQLRAEAKTAFGQIQRLLKEQIDHETGVQTQKFRDENPNVDKIDQALGIFSNETRDKFLNVLKGLNPDPKKLIADYTGIDVDKTNSFASIYSQVRNLVEQKAMEKLKKNGFDTEEGVYNALFNLRREVFDNKYAVGNDKKFKVAGFLTPPAGNPNQNTAVAAAPPPANQQRPLEEKGPAPAPLNTNLARQNQRQETNLGPMNEATITLKRRKELADMAKAYLSGRNMKTEYYTADVKKAFQEQIAAMTQQRLDVDGKIGTETTRVMRLYVDRYAQNKLEPVPAAQNAKLKTQPDNVATQ